MPQSKKHSTVRVLCCPLSPMNPPLASSKHEGLRTMTDFPEGRAPCEWFQASLPLFRSLNLLLISVDTPYSPFSNRAAQVLGRWKLQTDTAQDPGPNTAETTEWMVCLRSCMTVNGIGSHGFRSKYSGSNWIRIETVRFGSDRIGLDSDLDKKFRIRSDWAFRSDVVHYCILKL